jgi:hypothetical protein
MPSEPEDTLTDETAVVFITLGVIAAGLAVIWMAMSNRSRLREMEHRERLAKIERGIVPAPELDPAGFESRAGLPRPVEHPGALRSRSAGVMLIGLGLALIILITFVGNSSDVGVGVGGAFVMLGAAFLFNGVLLGRQAAHHPQSSAPSRTAAGRAEPPGGITS